MPERDKTTVSYKNDQLMKTCQILAFADIWISISYPNKAKIWKLDFDKFAPTECSIDDFGVGDTIGEISVRECKLDFGLAQRYENP